VAAERWLNETAGKMNFSPFIPHDADIALQKGGTSGVPP